MKFYPHSTALCWVCLPCLWRLNCSGFFSDIILDKPLHLRNYTVFCLFQEERIDGESRISNFLFAPYWRSEFVFKGSIFLHRLTPFIVCKLISNKGGKTDGCWHSSTGISPRPMLMGAAHNALWAFNARVSLTLPVRCRPQAATLALRSGAVRSPVTVVPSCGLETRSWRTGRMARHKQECIRLPYTAALASQRAFFVKVRGTARKGKHATPHSRISSGQNPGWR